MPPGTVQHHTKGRKSQATRRYVSSTTPTVKSRVNEASSAARPKSAASATYSTSNSRQAAKTSLLMNHAQSRSPKREDQGRRIMSQISAQHQALLDHDENGVQITCEKVLGDVLAHLQALLLRSRASHTAHDSASVRNHARRRASEVIENELSHIILNLLQTQGPSPSHRVVALSQVASDLLCEVEREIFTDNRVLLAALQDERRTRAEELFRLDAQYREELACRDQAIASLAADREELVTMAQTLSKEKRAGKAELDKASYTLNQLHQNAVELRMQGLDYRAKVESRCNKILDNVQTRMGFVPSGIHKQVAYLRSLKAPGDLHYDEASLHLHARVFSHHSQSHSLSHTHQHQSSGKSDKSSREIRADGVGARDGWVSDSEFEWRGRSRMKKAASSSASASRRGGLRGTKGSAAASSSVYKPTVSSTAARVSTGSGRRRGSGTQGNGSATDRRFYGVDDEDDDFDVGVDDDIRDDANTKSTGRSHTNRDDDDEEETERVLEAYGASAALRNHQYPPRGANTNTNTDSDIDRFDERARSRVMPTIDRGGASSHSRGSEAVEVPPRSRQFDIGVMISRKTPPSPSEPEPSSSFSSGDQKLKLKQNPNLSQTTTGRDIGRVGGGNGGGDALVVGELQRRRPLQSDLDWSHWGLSVQQRNQTRVLQSQSQTTQNNFDPDVDVDGESSTDGSDSSEGEFGTRYEDDEKDTSDESWKAAGKVSRSLVI